MRVSSKGAAKSETYEKMTRVTLPDNDMFAKRRRADRAIVSSK
jgi:hypothetical protein